MVNGMHMANHHATTQGPREFADDEKAYPTPKGINNLTVAQPADASGSGSEHGSAKGDVKDGDLAAKASEVSNL